MFSTFLPHDRLSDRPAPDELGSRVERVVADHAQLTHRTPSVKWARTPVAAIDQRRTPPDRRDAWRGGRRDIDWLHCPVGVLAQMATPYGSQRPWRAWLAARQPR